MAKAPSTKPMVAAVKRARRAIAEGDCTAALTELSHASYLRGRRDLEIEGGVRPSGGNWKVVTGAAMALERDYRARCVIKPGMSKKVRR